MSVVIDGTSGITTPAETVQGALTTTGNTILGDATTDTLTVGVTGIVKDASGNVGIGTSSPGTSNTAGASFVPGTSTVASMTGSNGSGQLLLGNNGGGSNLVANDSCGMIAFKGRFNGTFGGGNDIASIIGTYTGNGTTRSGVIRFLTLDSGAEAERMRIDSSGNLLVGTTSTLASGKLSIAFSGASQQGCTIQSDTASGSGSIYFRNPNGNVGSIQTSASSTTYATSSDCRLKDTIAPMTGALAKVALLKPCTYKWKSDGSDGQGFIAHELQAVVPDCVTGEKDAVDAEGNPQYQGIDTSFLVATLTAAIQELKAIVDAQAVRIAALES